MTDTSKEFMVYPPGSTPNSWPLNEAAAQSVERNQGKGSSPLTMTTSPESLEDFSASSAILRLERLNSTEPQPSEPPTIYKLSHKTMQCVLHWWNPALYVPGHQCLVETYPFE